MLSRELRSQVIQRSKEGKQYREISKELGVSLGSVANILRNHKTQSERSSTHQSPQETKSPQIEDASVEQDIDFSDNPYPDETRTIDALLSDSDYNPALDGVSGERFLGLEGNQEDS